MRINTQLPDRKPSSSTDDIDRQTVFKFDCVLLPFLSILFLLNSLDKANLGAAETGNFTRDVGIPDSSLNTAVAIFYVVFVVLQPLGAAVGRRVGMARFVPTCMALWGLCTILHIKVTNEWQLITLRVILAVLESGFYPTTVSYMSTFYTRYEFARRLGIFYGQAAVAGFVGGLLSWLVFSVFPAHDDSAVSETSWKGWQVLFVLEGSLTMIVAIIGFFWLPHSADTSWFLSEKQKVWARLRIVQDQARQTAERSDGENMDGLRTPNNISAVSLTDSPLDLTTPIYAETAGLMSNYAEAAMTHRRKSSVPYIRAETSAMASGDGLSWEDVTSAVCDRKIWYILIANILSAIPATAFSMFLPLVIKGLRSNAPITTGSPAGVSPDMDPAMANLLSVPPFAAGACVLWAFTAWSDRVHQRFKPILIGLVISMLGLAVTVSLPTHAHILRYVALMVLLAGSFVPSPLTVAWLTNNTPSPGKRAIVLGINGWGNAAGVLAALIFSPRFKDSGYAPSFAVTLLCVGVAGCMFWALRGALDLENRRRDSHVASWDHDLIQRETSQGDVHIEGLSTQKGDLLGRVIGLRVPPSQTRKHLEQRMTFRFGL